MLSTSSLPLLTGLLWPRVVIPVRVPSVGQIELFNQLHLYKELKEEEETGNFCKKIILLKVGRRIGWKSFI